MARCVMTRNCPHNLVYIPTYNLTDKDIVLGPDNSLAQLEAGDVESVDETELMPGEEGEVQKCGDFTFPVTVKSEQGHQWLPPDDEMPRKTQDNEPDHRTNFLPNFTKKELDEVDDMQRKEYWMGQGTAKEEEERLPEEKRIKMRDALAELEKLPRRDGEWIRGEVGELGDTKEKEVKEPNKRKFKIEEAPDEMVKQLFEEKLKLEENE